MLSLNSLEIEFTPLTLSLKQEFLKIRTACVKYLKFAFPEDSALPEKIMTIVWIVWKLNRKNY